MYADPFKIGNVRGGTDKLCRRLNTNPIAHRRSEGAAELFVRSRALFPRTADSPILWALSDKVHLS